MNRLSKIKNKYNQILNSYQNQYSFDETTTQKFKELNNLFLDILNKDINNINTVIDKRNEYDFLTGILSNISGEFNKLKAKELEEKYLGLFEHRKKVVIAFKKYNNNVDKKDQFQISPKVIRDPVIIPKPEYGYHVDNPKYPLLDDDYKF